MNGNPNFDELIKIPGADGCMWRLFQLWDPNKITDWMKREQLLATDDHVLGPQLGRVMATATMFFAKHTSDPAAAISGKYGVVPAYKAATQALVNDHASNRTKSGLIIPPQRLQ